jgi:BirA family transcriptional regulator, biotin operon repressor / biotin---[acetyl-CoA-carboxylase] ligase
VIGRPLIRLDEVDSTQRLAFDLAASGAPAGTVVRAGYQSGGRGRSGRSWTVPAGEALLFSVLLRPDLPPAQLAPLSLMVGEAIASVLEGMLHLRPAIKWPNDLLIEGRKVAGILIQTRRDHASGQTIAVVGIGLNVSSPRGQLPEGATSLQAELGQAFNVECLFRAVLAAIDERYGRFLSGETAASLGRVNRQLWLKGKTVTLDDAGNQLTGIVQGIDEAGALILTTPDGLRRVVSGELTRGPRLA